MDGTDFQNSASDLAKFITKYLDTIATRRPFPNVTPGYIRSLIPDEAPQNGEGWDTIRNDIDSIIMPGVTHWHSPHFHAYYPTGNSYPSILGDMLSDAIGCVGFTWASSPACTELEVVMMDWLAKMLQLPQHFLFTHPGNGGGIIQGSASEATLVALLSARTAAMRRMKVETPQMTQGQMVDKLVAYTSEESHFSTERAALIGLVQLRSLPCDAKGALRGDTLQRAVREDVEQGLVPFFLCTTVGTTTRCTFDNLTELGPICDKNYMWMHVDAAYAGSACICPEYRYLIDGIEHAMSFSFNPHKWLRVSFDCAAMWVKDRDLIAGAFEVDPLIMKHDNQDQVMPDYRHWQIPLGRRFRSLKLWFVIRSFGVLALQEQIRKDISLAKMFERLILEDQRFEIVADVVLGLVCFRLKGENSLNERLNKLINTDRRIHLVPSKVNNIYFLRSAICASSTTEEHVKFAWEVVREMADKLTASV